MQTKNAIGNLINRYRAVLKKCNLLNTFGTLAIASAFAMSGAGLAGAAPISGTDGLETDTENTTATASELTVDASGNLSLVGASGKSTATITGAADDADILELGTISITGTGAATTLTFDSADDIVSGNITLDGSANKAEMIVSKQTSFFMSQDTANIIAGNSSTVANQTLTINGEFQSTKATSSDEWQDLTLGNGGNGVTVEIGDGGQLGAKNLTLADDSVLNAAGKTITVNAKNEDRTLDEYSVLLSNLTLTKGTVNADTIHLIGENTTDTYTSEALTLTGNGNAKANIIAENATLTGNGAAVAVDDTHVKSLALNGFGAVSGDVTVGENGALTVTKINEGDKAQIAGKLTVNHASASATINEGSVLDVTKGMEIGNNGGTVDIKGTLNIDGNGAAAFAQAAGTVNLAEGALLTTANSGGNASTIVGTFNHNGVSFFDEGVTVGANTTLTVKDIQTAADVDSADKTKNGTVYVATGKNVGFAATSGRIQIDNEGVFDLNGSAIDLSSNAGTVAVKDTVTELGSYAANIIASKYKATDAQKGSGITLGTNLTILNGIDNFDDAQDITIDSNGSLTLGSAEEADLAFFGGVEQGGEIGSKIIADKGDLTVANGRWTLANVQIGESDLVVSGGETTINAITINGNSKGDFTFSGGNTTFTSAVDLSGANSNGAITVSGDDFDATTVTFNEAVSLKGDFIVHGGTVTFDKTLTENNGGSTIAIGDNNNAKVILGDTIALSNSTLKVLGHGQLVVNFDQAVGNNGAVGDNFAALNGSSTGLLVLKGEGESTTKFDSFSNYDTYAGNVLNSSQASIKLDGVGIDGDVNLDDLVAATNTNTLIGVTIGMDQAKTIDDKDVVVSNIEANGDYKITVGSGNNSSLTLVGGAEDKTELQDLDKGDHAIAIELGDKGTLNFGLAAEENAVGNLDGVITVANDASAINAVNGTFTVAKIAEDSNGGNVSNGTALAVDNADFTVTGAENETTNVNTVNLANGGKFTVANGNINIRGAVDANTNNGGAITAQNGNITLNSTMDGGALIAENGAITAHGNLGGSTALTSIEATKLTVDNGGTVSLDGGEDGGVLNLTGEDASTIAGAFDAARVSGEVNNIEFSDTAKVFNGSNMTFGTFKAGNTTTFGDASNDATGSHITIDTFNGTSDLTAASRFDNNGSAVSETVVSIKGFDDGAGDTKVNNHIIVGNNAVVGLGTDDADSAWATASAANTLTDGSTKAFGADGYTAAMVIADTIELGSTGGIAVGNGASASDGTINTAAGSLLIFDGNTLTLNADDAAITGVTGNGSAIAGDISLLNVGAGTYALFAGDGGDLASLNFTGDVITNNLYLEADTGWEEAKEADIYKVNIKVNTNKPGESGDSIFSDNLGDLIGSYVAGGNGTNAFLDFASNTANFSSKEASAATIEGAAKAPMVIGAPKIALDVATMGSDYAMARTSFAPRVAGAYAMDDNGQAQNIASGDNMANGMNVWIMPMYEHSSVDGLDSGLYELNYDNDFYGVALGADYTWDNSFRLGATLNFGTGDAETKGDSSFNKTENDYDSIGVGLYAGYMINNFGISGDFMYTHIKNDIDQKIAGYKTLTGEGDTDVISLGLRGEYKIETSAMDIIPHVGIRYNHIDMDDMTFSGELTTSADSANVWQLPLGVTFARDFATESGWNVKPSLDLSLIPAFGDTDMDQSVRFAGVNGLATMNTEIMDELSGRAQVGVEASYGNFYMGLDYAYQGSSNVDAHQVQANFGFKF